MAIFDRAVRFRNQTNSSKQTNIIEDNQNHESLENKRNHERFTVKEENVMVFNLDTASVLGHLESISVGGFLLRSTQPIKLEHEFRISLSFPDRANEKSVVRCAARSLWGCEAESLWQGDDQLENAYWTGYEFVDISESALQTIAQFTKISNRS